MLENDGLSGPITYMVFKSAKCKKKNLYHFTIQAHNWIAGVPVSFAISYLFCFGFLLRNGLAFVESLSLALK